METIKRQVFIFNLKEAVMKEKIDAVLETANQILTDLGGIIFNKFMELSRDKTYPYDSRISFERTKHVFVQRTMCRFKKLDGSFAYSMTYWVHLKGIGARDVIWDTATLTDEEVDHQLWLYCLDWVNQWIEENTMGETTVVRPFRVDLKKENFPWGND